MQSNPVARWHICQGSINSIAFSTDGTFLSTVGRDGTLSQSSLIFASVSSLFVVFDCKIYVSSTFNCYDQVTYVFLTTIKSSLCAVAKVITVRSYVVLGGVYFLAGN